MEKYDKITETSVIIQSTESKQSSFTEQEETFLKKVENKYFHISNKGANALDESNKDIDKDYSNPSSNSKNQELEEIFLKFSKTVNANELSSSTDDSLSEKSTDSENSSEHKFKDKTKKDISNSNQTTDKKTFLNKKREKSFNKSNSNSNSNSNQSSTKGSSIGRNCGVIKRDFSLKRTDYKNDFNNNTNNNAFLLELTEKIPLNKCNDNKFNQLKLIYLENQSILLTDEIKIAPITYSNNDTASLNFNANNNNFEKNIFKDNKQDNSLIKYKYNDSST
jgi:hypothetical protein